MSMLTAAIPAIATITVIVTRITAALSATPRTDQDHSTTRAIPTPVSTRARRQPTRSRPVRAIRPQYLPALARARILRLQTSHLALTTTRRHQLRYK
jgi:hypothetical protein